ncbi:uncharacterized protein LOC116765994 [Danaus plexippus]|uniref:uncharacterized protein LOC116765994 n=1 Tax=Danaus plexippus TaxID=13037 RepID=UPI002AB25F57|nr:uncharacterized protein LOC116765994 [Danaus plexippus]
MVFQLYLIFALATLAYAVPAPVADENGKTLIDSKQINEINDLKTASSSYSHQYSDWGGRNPSGYSYSVTGFGTIDDKYTADPLYKEFNGYDNSLKLNSYPGLGNDGYNSYGGYKGGFAPSRFEPVDSVRSGYGNYGYNSNDYDVGGRGYGLSNNGYGIGSSGYGKSGSPYGFGGNGYPGSYGGNGGYGGYGGNGGLNSYSGYNNPYYQGGGHLGYGYQTKKLGYGSIYNSGVTPSLVTGYRGYTRR